MDRKARMVVFAVTGVVMAIGLFVFVVAPEKNKNVGLQVVHAEALTKVPEFNVARPSDGVVIERLSSSVPSSSMMRKPSAPVELVGDAVSPGGQPQVPGGYLARIQLDAPDQVEAALRRAQLLYETGEIRPGDAPLTFVLHGPEVAIFFKENYEANQVLVDLAAKLSAFEVVDMKVCETRLGVFGESRQSLAPFISTVPFGPSEISRLINEEEFVYF